MVVKFLVDPNSGDISFELKDIFGSDIKVTFKEFYNFFNFLDASRNGNKTYIKIESSHADKPLEMCLGVPEFNLCDEFPVIFEAIKSTYQKLCDLNIEDKTILTHLIWEKFGHFQLFSFVGKNYDPEYLVEFENTGQDTPKSDVVLFNSLIEFEEIKLVSFVAFFGSTERIRENVLLGRFHKSEYLGEYVVDTSCNIDLLLKNESKQYEKELSQRGFNVLL